MKVKKAVSEGGLTVLAQAAQQALALATVRIPTPSGCMSPPAAASVSCCLVQSRD